MNTREIFLRIVGFESSPRTLKWECGYWAGTVMRWYNEGLPKSKGFYDSFLWGDGIAGPFGRTYENLDSGSFDVDISSFFKLDKGTSTILKI